MRSISSATSTSWRPSAAPMPSRDTRNIVLVVDDSPDTLRMLTDAIEDAGMTVLVAREGAHALSMIDRVTPDVILLDAVMPGMDGFETCRRLKRNNTLVHVPIIFMTGLSETEDIVKGLEAGGVDYVTKPIVPEELIARIRVHLANARMAHSARAALDVSGRVLLAASQAGRILWYTPQAGKLLGGVFGKTDVDGLLLPPDVQAWLALQTPAGAASPPIGLGGADAPKRLQLHYIGQITANEILLRLVEADTDSDEFVLRRKLSLTQREAEVLLWIARGKSNRDIGAILDLSPRTVNKHLEQIYNKLGVENRTSAAALAVRTIGVR
jgi:DNA-binding response OmpR family regulator/DNA-binding CsgD family transcriptional regulator